VATTTATVATDLAAAGSAPPDELRQRVGRFVDEARDRRAVLAERLGMADEFLGRLAALPGSKAPSA